MKDRTASRHQITGRILPIAGVAALAVALTVALPQPAHAKRVTPPPVPDNIRVPAGNEAFLVGHAFGTQNYVCLPSGASFAWTLFTPQANLFNDKNRQITTHFFGPNPDENGAIRAVWQDSQDTSSIWGRAVASSTDANFVAPGAIPWLRIEVVGAEEGPTGGRRLLATTFIHRLNTVGGVAPSTGCAGPTDVGRTAFVPYSADYFFYRGARSDDDEEEDSH
jgi:hypothetical protein